MSAFECHKHSAAHPFHEGRVLAQPVRLAHEHLLHGPAAISVRRPCRLLTGFVAARVALSEL
jgi:hypothetical protein